MDVTGAEALFKALEDEEVEVVFGIPGGAILPAYDPLIDSPIRHVLMRHEQGAGHAAEGYAQASGRVGVCMVTSGPGACNLVTPICDAMMDSVPLVAITGQVATGAMGRQAFQEAPVTDITRPITKRNWLVRDPEEIAQVIHDAFGEAARGRPGPVLVDIPKDVLQARTNLVTIHAVSRWRPPLDLAAIRVATDLIAAAERPVLYLGGGVIKSDAAVEVRELAELAGLPVVTTLMARGAFPDSHPLAFGMPGMHGGYAPVMAMQRADLLINVGARFDDRVTGRLDGFAPRARVIHVDVDPSEIGKNRRADVALVGDARPYVAALVRALRGETMIDRQEWLATVRDWKRRYPFAYEQSPEGPLKPQFVIERLHAATGGDAIVTSGVGQHQMWASQLWAFERPRTWINSGGLGTMGFALPAALGAKVACPDRRVVAIDGDGCFQMTTQELATSTAEGIPVIVAILNNGHLGMVRQWQEMFYNERYSQVHLGQELPDYRHLAQSYGCIGLRAESPAEVDDVIAQALGVEGRTVVIDFRVDQTEKCFPIVPAGATNDDIILGPAITAAGELSYNVL